MVIFTSDEDTATCGSVSRTKTPHLAAIALYKFPTGP